MGLASKWLFAPVLNYLQIQSETRQQRGWQIRAHSSNQYVLVEYVWVHIYNHHYAFSDCHILILTLVKHYYKQPNIVLVPLLLSEQPGPFESWTPGDPWRTAGVSDSSMVAADISTLSDVLSSTFLTQMLVGLRSGESTPQTVVVLLKPDSWTIGPLWQVPSSCRKRPRTAGNIVSMKAEHGLQKSWGCMDPNFPKHCSVSTILANSGAGCSQVRDAHVSPLNMVSIAGALVVMWQQLFSGYAAPNVSYCDVSLIMTTFS